MERTPKKHVAEEFEELDYSDLYGDLSVSTVTAGPNLTDYEVSPPVRVWRLCCFPSVSHCLCVCRTHKIVEYEDYDNTTDLSHVNEYEYEEEEERYGPAERERAVLLNTQVRVQLLVTEPLLFITRVDIFVFSF